MPSLYSIANTNEIYSPGLVVFRDLVDANLAEMIRVAGDAKRLRPHAKTHKMPELTKRELALGIDKHKCATLAEAEMLAQAGATDVLLAYPLVGPNIGRAVRLLEKYPDLKLACTADHRDPAFALGRAMSAANKSIEVLIDLDTGQGRTGLAAAREVQELYATIARIPGLKPGGLHLYDGQNHQSDLNERRDAVSKCWRTGSGLRDELVAAGLSVPRIVAGGTPSFPIYAGIEDPALELSPGTIVFHDSGYGRAYPDLHFTPAAVLLGRVISLRGPTRVTLDLGTKACASDPPAGNRLSFPDLPDAKEILQNEEHLVIETSAAAKFRPGDVVLAIPRHICPSVALHRTATVVSGGKVVDEWLIAGRDRQLTV